MPSPALLDAVGRVALVTGAAGGIGRAVVSLLEASGAGVAAFDRASHSLGGLPIIADVTDELAMSNAVARVIAAFGRIDYLVHAAGFAKATRLDAMSVSQWREVIDVNLTSAFLVTRAAYAALKASRGAVVLFSSTNGRTGGSALSGPAYAVAKAGIINLNRYLAKEWAPDGIRVNCIAPGPVATPMLDRFSAIEQEALRTSIPLQHITSADEIAAQVGFLLSTHARSITGACLNVSGGLVLD